MTTEAKPAWTRCKQCKQRLFNDPIDIETHRAVCPADLKRAIIRLAAKVEALEARPEPVSAEPASGEPALDLEAFAPWPDDEDEEPVVDAGVFEEILAIQPVVPRAIDDYDDEDEDEEPARISGPVMR